MATLDPNPTSPAPPRTRLTRPMRPAPQSSKESKATRRRQTQRERAGLPPAPTPRQDPSSPLAPGNYYSLARASGLSRQHIARVLQGRGGVTLEAAERIAKAAGVSMLELLEYIKDSKSKNKSKSISSKS